MKMETVCYICAGVRNTRIIGLEDRDRIKQGRGVGVGENT